MADRAQQQRLQAGGHERRRPPHHPSDPAPDRQRIRGAGSFRFHHLCEGPGDHSHGGKLSGRGRLPGRDSGLHEAARLQQHHHRGLMGRTCRRVRQARDGCCGRLYGARRHPAGDRPGLLRGRHPAHHAPPGALHHPRSCASTATLAGGGGDPGRGGGRGRRAFRAWGGAILRRVFAGMGGDGARWEPEDLALRPPRLIGVLGTFGDDEIVGEAKSRFAKFVSDPTSLPTALRETVTGLAGRYADRTIYDTLLALGRGTTNTDERVRYYMAAASARDPALADETLAMALTDELPTTLVSRLISEVASQGEHRDLAWNFVKANFAALAAKQGPSFPEDFPPVLMTNFTDPLQSVGMLRFAA